MSPAKNGGHIGIMSPSASLCCHTFGFRSITFEGMHQFHSNFREMSSIIQYSTILKVKVIRKILIELWPFLLRVLLNCRYEGR